MSAGLFFTRWLCVTSPAASVRVQDEKPEVPSLKARRYTGRECKSSPHLPSNYVLERDYALMPISLPDEELRQPGDFHEAALHPRLGGKGARRKGGRGGN